MLRDSNFISFTSLFDAILLSLVIQNIMSHPKRNNATYLQITISKKQQLECINRLCNDFYPSYQSDKTNYSSIKNLVNSNLNIYPWLTKDIIHNGLR